MKRWIINRPDEVKSAEFAAKCDLSQLTIDVLTSRGYTSFEQVIDFFKEDELTDPSETKDMLKAAREITKSVDKYELICVYGDYDCDGITSTAVLFRYLDSIGANVMYYIPERDDGYGLNESAIRMLYERGVKLIVTVDNGISAVEEAKLINELDMKLIITDHHQPSEELPDALAIVDPHQKDCTSEFKDLCGVGVALKLCAALDDCNYDIVMEQFADICAIGTIADVVPLRGENRTLVKRGLRYLSNTENPGLSSLMELTRIDPDNVSSSMISFKMSPVINASGRLSTPLNAVKTLLTEDEEEARTYAELLVNLNRERKNVEAQILGEIVNYLNEHPEVLDQKVLVLDGRNWHHGVIGIISARIMDFYGKPSFIITSDDDGNARGSARSIKGFNVFKCLQFCSSYLTKFGGHECAGGFSLYTKNIEAFRLCVYEFASKIDKFPHYTLTADKLLRPADITAANVKGLSALEPFGEANSQPVFAILGAQVGKITPLSQGQHTRIVFTYGSYSGEALLFGLSPEDAVFSVGDRLDMLVSLEINRFNGRESVSIRVIDHRISGIKQERYFAAKDSYEKLMRDEDLPDSFIRKMIPTRQELVNVYKYISAVKTTMLDTLYMRLSSDALNYCKLRLCVDIFAEKSLIEYKPATGKIKWVKPEQKVDLSDSKILAKLDAML